MPWPEGRPRSPSERLRISNSVRDYYAKGAFTRGRTRKKVWETKINNALESVPRANLRMDYFLWLKARGMKDSTMEKELRALKIVYPRKSIKRMSFKDILHYFERINRIDASPGYKATLKNTAKNLFKMYRRGDEVSWVKTQPTLRRDRYVKLSEVRKCIEISLHFEEKLFLSLLWEGCFRRSELINLRLADIRQEKGVIFLRVSGKTGQRNVPIMPRSKAFPLGSYTMLRKFLRMLPGGREYLFSYKDPAQIDYLFKKIRHLTGKKDMHAHLFRKSRATYLDSIKVPIQHIRLFGGWSFSSMTVLRTYILTNERGLVDMFREYN